MGTIERKNPDCIHGLSRAETERFCDDDLRIRQGLCPNCKDTLLQQTEHGQHCDTCRFSTNVRCELEAD